jgi:DNA-binding MarR family transcriptional regulator
MRSSARGGETIVGVTANRARVAGSSRAQGDDQASPLTLYLVKRLELAVRALMDDALRPMGLTAMQYTALSVLERRDGLSSAQLARRSFLRPQTMHEMVLALEGRGLIARERDPRNRRVLLASLTEDGRDLLKRCEPTVMAIEERMLSSLSAGQREVFRESLDAGVASLAAVVRSGGERTLAAE